MPVLPLSQVEARFSEIAEGEAAVAGELSGPGGPARFSPDCRRAARSGGGGLRRASRGVYRLRSSIDEDHSVVSAIAIEQRRDASRTR